MMNGADPNDVADFRIQKYLYDAPVRGTHTFAALFGGQGEAAGENNFAKFLPNG